MIKTKIQPLIIMIVHLKGGLDCKKKSDQRFYRFIYPLVGHLQSAITMFNLNDLTTKHKTTSWESVRVCCFIFDKSVALGPFQLSLCSEDS